MIAIYTNKMQYFLLSAIALLLIPCCISNSFDVTLLQDSDFDLINDSLASKSTVENRYYNKANKTSSFENASSDSPPSTSPEMATTTPSTSPQTLTRSGNRWNNYLALLIFASVMSGVLYISCHESSNQPDDYIAIDDLVGDIEDSFL